MTRFFHAASQRLAGLNPLLFIYLTWLATYVVLLPLILLDNVVVSDALHQSSGPTNLPRFNMGERLWVGAVITPVVETALFQWLPIRIVRTWLKLPVWVAVLVSATLFGFGHTYSIGYVVYTFMIGLVLAYAFTLKDYRQGQAYMLICIVHAIRNTVSSLLM